MASSYPELEYVYEHLYYSKRQERASGAGLYVSDSGEHYRVTEANLLPPHVEPPAYSNATYLGHVRCKFVRPLSKHYGHQYLHLYFSDERNRRVGGGDYITSEGLRLRVTAACLAPREPAIGERYLGRHLCMRL